MIYGKYKINEINMECLLNLSGEVSCLFVDVGWRRGK